MKASQTRFSDLFAGQFLDKWKTTRPAPRLGDQPIISLHVPKTAGSAFAEFLIASLGSFHTIEHGRIDETFDEFLDNYGTRRIANGHIQWSHVQRAIERPDSYHFMTNLREPVARAVSNFTYCWSEKHPEHAEFRRAFPDIDTYIAWGGMSRNYQTRLLAGRDVGTAEEAIERIDSTYDFVGIAELFSVSCFLFSLAFGRPIRVADRAVNTARDRTGENHAIPDTAYDAIRRQNDIDTPVYEHFRALYEQRMEDLFTMALRSRSW